MSLGSLPASTASLVAHLVELLLQRRQRGAGLRQQGLLREYRRASHAPQFELFAEYAQLFVFFRGDPPGCLDLRAQRRFLDGRGHDVGGHREISGLQLETLVIDLRVQRFELTPRAAEHVEFVRHVHRCVVQIELIDHPGLAERDAVQFFAGGAKLRVDARQKGAACLRREVFARLPQCGLRGGDVRTVDERLTDQRVERLAMKERPPGGGNVLSRREALR